MPQLTPEQLTQLDTNIKSMLENGGTQADVENYAKDFRERYDVKKKNGQSQNGTADSPQPLLQDGNVFKNPTEIVSEFSVGGSLFPKVSDNGDGAALPINKPIKIADVRSVDAVTGKPVPDTSRMSGVASPQTVQGIIQSAVKHGIDPYTALAVAYQETKLDNDGSTEGNPFHLIDNTADDLYDSGMKLLKEKMELGKRLGKKDEAAIIQAFNGYGKVGKNTEGTHRAFYGIDVSQSPIDMNVNPVYGKRIIDIRENIIKKNPELVGIVNQLNAPQQKEPITLEQYFKKNTNAVVQKESALSPFQLKTVQQQQNDVRMIGADIAKTTPERQDPNIQQALKKLQVNPNDDAAIYQLGYGNLGINNTAAQNLFEKALQVNPNNYKAKIGLADISFVNGDYDAALKYRQDAMSGIPKTVTLADGKEYNNPDYANNVLGITQAQALTKQNLDEAQTTIDEILKGDPKNVLALQVKADIKRQQGHDIEAKDLTWQAVAANSENASAPTLYNLEQKWKREHPEADEDTFIAQWLQSHADVANKIAMEMGGNQGAGEFVANLIDPVGYVMGNIEGVKQGLHHMGEGIAQMNNAPQGTKAHVVGLTKAILGGTEATFATLMTTPHGFVFVQGLHGTDMLSDDEASKYIMSPLTTMFPAQDELVQNIEAIGDLAIVIGLGVAAKIATKSDAGKAKKIRETAQKIKDGNPVSKDDTRLFTEVVAEGTNPETLKEVIAASEKIPEGTSQTVTTEVIPLIIEKETAETQIQTLQAEKSKLDKNFHPQKDEEIAVQDDVIKKADKKLKSITEQKKQDTRTKEPTIEDVEEVSTVENKPQSILGSEVDLKGNPKEEWMIEAKKISPELAGKKKALEKRGNDLREQLSELKRDIKVNGIDETSKAELDALNQRLETHNKRVRDLNYDYGVENINKEVEIKDARNKRKFHDAIEEGRMTAQDAATIIKSAGLEVPKDIADKAGGDKGVGAVLQEGKKLNSFGEKIKDFLDNSEARLKKREGFNQWVIEPKIGEMLNDNVFNTKKAAKEFWQDQLERFGYDKTEQPTPKKEPQLTENQPKTKLQLAKEKLGEGEFTKKGKELADRIRGLKSKPLELKDENGNPIIIEQAGFDFNPIIEAIAKGVEKGGELIDVIKAELEKAKWYQNLTDKGKDAVTAQLRAQFEGEVPKEVSKQAGEPTVVGTNEKAILKHLVDSENISDVAKRKLEEQGLKYEPHSHEEARSLATEIVKGVGEDAAVSYAESGRFSGDINSSIFAVSIDRIAAKEVAARKAGDISKADALGEKWADISIRYDEAARSGGRFTSQIYDFYKKSPLGIKIKEQKIRQQAFNDWYKGTKEEAYKEFWGEVTRNPQFQALVEKGAEGFKVKAKKVADKIRSAKLEDDIILGGIPFAKQVINGSIEIMAKTVEAGGTIVEAVAKGIEHMKNTDWYKKLSETDKPQADTKLENYLNKLSEKSETLPKKKIPKEQEDKIVEKWSNKLKGLPEAKKEQFIRDIVRAVVEKGELSYADFKKILSDAVGRGKFTPKESEMIDKYVEAANNVTDLADKAQAEGTTKAIKAYDDAVKIAERLGTDLGNILYKEPNLTNRFTSFVSLNTLGLGTLLKNIGYNVSQQALIRFPKALIGTAFDYTAYGISLVANKTFGSPILKPETNIWFAQRGYFKGLATGTKEAFRKLRSGATHKDYFKQGIQHSPIKPLQSARDLWSWKKGEKVLAPKEVIDKAVQIFPGTLAEVIGRGLFLGDNPPRWAAEYAKAEQIARLKFGIKDKKEIELFKRFPEQQAQKLFEQRGLSAEEAQKKAQDIVLQLKEAGDDATLTMDNMATDFAQQAKQWGEQQSKSGEGKSLANTAARVFGVVNIPYLKIPLNAAWLAMNIRNPILPLVQSAYYGFRAVKTKDPAMWRKSKDWAAVAAVGVTANTVAAWMANETIITPRKTDKEEKKESDIMTEFDRQYSMNIHKLMRGGGATRDGDFSIDLSWFGSQGAVLNTAAQQRNRELEEGEMKGVNELFFNLSRGGIDGFTQSVFGGTSALINAYTMGGGYVNQLGLQYANMFMNVFDPAMIAQTSKHGFGRNLDIRDDTFSGALSKDIYQRSFGFVGKEPETKLGIFGEPQLKNQSYFGRVLTGTFGMEIADTDKLGYTIYEMYNQNHNAALVPPTIPKTISVDGKDKPLTYDQQRELTALIGATRIEFVGAFLDNKATLNMNGEDKYMREMNEEQIAETLKSMYDKGGDLGREKFKLLHPEFQSTEITPTTDPREPQKGTQESGVRKETESQRQ